MEFFYGKKKNKNNVEFAGLIHYMQKYQQLSGNI